MVEHIVLFKFKESATADQIEAMHAGLRRLQDKAPGIIDLTVGSNFTDRGKGYQSGLVVRLADRDALAVYRDHPAHQEVLRDFIQPIVEDVIAVDYEI